MSGAPHLTLVDDTTRPEDLVEDTIVLDAEIDVEMDDPSTDLPVITMPTGLPAFEWAQRFVLVPWGPDGSPYTRLQCLDDEELAFLVVEPSLFFPEYAPEIDDATAARLGIHAAEDALLLVILTVGSRPEDATANLLGPIVVNWRTRTAEQVILSDNALDTRVPLAAA